MKKSSLVIMTAVSLALGSPRPAVSQELPGRGDNPIVSAIDQHIRQFIKSDEPGGAVIVVKDKETIFRRAYGMASLELGVKMEPPMVFAIGSLTKQFTAVAAVWLAENGRLSLADEIGKYFPDFPGARQIRIRHLLSHTSGIKDYIPLSDFQSRMREDLSNADVLEIVKKEPLEFPAGEKCVYSNSNYALVGAIIEKVTGQAYSYLHAAGGLCTNIDDLAKWNNALFDGRVISPASLAECLTPQKLKSGESSGTGMGWFVDTLYGRRYVYHGGGIYGFVNHTLFLPEEGLYIAVLRNFINRTTDTRRMAESIAGIVLGEQAAPDSAATISLSAEQKSRYVGVYKFDDGSVRRVMLTGGRLYYGIDEERKVEIFPESATKFHQPGGRVQIEFQFDDSGEVVSMVAAAGEQSKTGLKQSPNDQPK
jgi:D-alanyl-D-alanine carboxypeptidase